VSLPTVDTLAPDELNDVTLAALAAANQLLGACPTTGKPVFMKSGPHGPYVQRGDNADADKKRQSLLQGQLPADIDLAMALRLLDLPLALGFHPTSGVPIVAHVGKHGPYVKCGEESRSLPRGLSPLDVTLDAALALLAEPRRGKGSRGKSASIRSLGVSPLTGKPVDVRDGKYGLYVTDGQTNATLPEGVAPDEVNLEQALGLIAARPPKKRKRR
jgi:DNA topoisomerase-1